MKSDDAVQIIAGLFASDGMQDYLGEPVSQAAHMLQTAALAERDGAPARWSPRPCCMMWATSPGS